MKRNNVLEEIYNQQPPNVRVAIDALEARGMKWCVDFGHTDALDWCERLGIEITRNDHNYTRHVTYTGDACCICGLERWRHIAQWPAPRQAR